MAFVVLSKVLLMVVKVTFKAVKVSQIGIKDLTGSGLGLMIKDTIEYPTTSTSYQTQADIS